MKDNNFQVGKVYSFGKIKKNSKEAIMQIYGLPNGGTHGVHLQFKDYDVWFVMDKEKGYTGGKYFNYKCVYIE
ncbi:MAG: hypothetical protein KC414_03420 [Romboutsia sp.]|nr:hypothetical protein [Romboutsia sp.]